MNLTELKEDFEAIINNISSIKTFCFDDLSSINIDRDKSYPGFLLKPPQSRIPVITEPYENYKIDFIIFDLFKQDDYKSLSETWDNLKALADIFINVIYEDNQKYIITSEITIERGHLQHNDNLISIRYQFELKVFDCRE